MFTINADIVQFAVSTFYEKQLYHNIFNHNKKTAYRPVSRSRYLLGIEIQPQHENKKDRVNKNFV